ncbi:HalOD1 output domain-containing protein [Halorussus marinus]|uniref:HalOD1 output domain-containing protein n=1 Tax=Halorussus marinus TaxID=2505976 RepID=UPI00106E14C6|nr:HalOD1 output domain-containing protein [Halorussus marinus]
MNEPIHDTAADSVPVRIVNAVADATGRDPNALPPLYDTVDPDALAAIVARAPNHARGGDEIEVSFAFADCDVTVSPTRGVEVAVAVGGDARRPDAPAPVDE